MLRDEAVGDEARSWCAASASKSKSKSKSKDADAQTHSGVHVQHCVGLHRTLKRIVKARGALDAQEAAALREAEQLRVWRHYGYSSLLEYMEMEMGYSPRMALERLRVAKAIVELPVIAEAITQGDLSFSAARELTRVATPGTEELWLEAIDDKNLRQVEELVSGHKRGEKPSDPVDPKLRKRRLRYADIDQETVALLRQAKQILERERGERIDDNALLRTFARMVVDGVASPERTRAPYQIAVTTCEVCKRAWQDGGGVTVEMAPATAEVALCDAQHIGSVDGEHDQARSVDNIAIDGHAIDGHAIEGRAIEGRAIEGRAIEGRAIEGRAIEGRAIDARASDPPPTREPSTGRTSQKRATGTKRARSSIPPALRRKVKARDHGTCQVPWCRSSRNVDQHHLQPVSRGGAHTLENLITLCESHHIALHDGTLVVEGTASSPRFERRVHSSFTNAQHAVDTTAALKALGFDKHEVAAAIDKTRTHVGTAALTLEQWIKIALGHCPSARSVTGEARAN